MATAVASKPLKVASTKASTSVALKKPNAANLVSIKDALKAQVALLSSRIAPPTGNKIRATQDKQFILPDGTKTPGPLSLVIVDFSTTHEFYETGFDKDNILPPGCFAIGSDPKKMFPSANVPNKQADDCQSCPMNQWGSNGKGKACGNGRLLAVLPPDSTADTPMWLLRLSATAIKEFDGYVAGVARSHQAMPIEVITTISFDPNQTYAKMVCSDPQPNINLAEHFGRQAEAKELFEAERDVSGWVDPNAKPAKGPAPKKASARR